MKSKSNSLVPKLYVSDFKNSCDFYIGILEFSIIYQRIDEGFTFLSLGKAQIMIDEICIGKTWKTGEFEYQLGRGINFQIEVESIIPLLKKLKENNVNLFLDVEYKWYRKNDVEVSNRQFLVQDPDGYLLRFMQDLGERQYR